MVSIWKNTVSSPSSLLNRYLWNFPFEEILINQGLISLERGRQYRSVFANCTLKESGSAYFSNPYPLLCLPGTVQLIPRIPLPFRSQTTHYVHLVLDFQLSTLLPMYPAYYPPKSQSRCTWAHYPHPPSPKADGFPSCPSQFSCCFLKGTTPTTPTQGRPHIPGPFSHWALFWTLPWYLSS